MALVVPTVCRYSINATYLGNPCVNVIDMSVGDIGSSREIDCNRVAAVIMSAWSQFMLPIWTNQYVANSIDYVDLATEDGPTGTVTSTAGWAVQEYTWPKAGAGSSQGMPGNVSLLVTKGAGRSRATRSGRMFLAPGPESAHNGNVLEPAYVTTVNNALASFLDYITDDVTPPQPETMVVVHKPSLINPSYTKVTGLTVNSIVSTQRRRLRR